MDELYEDIFFLFLVRKGSNSDLRTQFLMILYWLNGSFLLSPVIRVKCLFHIRFLSLFMHLSQKLLLNDCDSGPCSYGIRVKSQSPITSEIHSWRCINLVTLSDREPPVMSLSSHKGTAGNLHFSD